MNEHDLYTTLKCGSNLGVEVRPDIGWGADPFFRSYVPLFLKIIQIIEENVQNIFPLTFFV